jgi:FKBP-type peptidyl-prolyl cis-trans isomerase FkpA
MKLLLRIFVLSLILISCTKKKEQELKDEQDKSISEYITSNNIDATKSSSGLYYFISKEGSSKKPNSTSQVRVSYNGYLLNGTEFDKSDSTGVVFKLNQVIEGWTEGIPYFGEGGEGTLIIPSYLGYGSQTKSNIPKNSILIFDIVLLDVY